jgi:hypothetical protein
MLAAKDDKVCSFFAAMQPLNPQLARGEVLRSSSTRVASDSNEVHIRISRGLRVHIVKHSRIYPHYTTRRRVALPI